MARSFLLSGFRLIYFFRLSDAFTSYSNTSVTNVFRFRLFVVFGWIMKWEITHRYDAHSLIPNNRCPAERMIPVGSHSYSNVSVIYHLPTLDSNSVYRDSDSSTQFKFQISTTDLDSISPKTQPSRLNSNSIASTHYKLGSAHAQLDPIWM